MSSPTPTLAPVPQRLRPADRLLAPFLRYARLETTSSLVLLLATVAALVLANSPLASLYQRTLSLPLALGVGATAWHATLESAINDGLMAVFFLVVGLEVKREILLGELASFRRALLPVFAAFGGVVTPALLYALLHALHGAAQPAGTARGWGIPIATDIAFSLAVMTAFGARIPTGLKIFLVTLAIVDDIAGVLVIAFAYNTGVHWQWLGAATGIFLVILLLNRLGVSRLTPYAVLGVALWCAFSASGVHPTLSGVLLALAIPSSRPIEPSDYAQRGVQRIESIASSDLQAPGRGHELREHLRALRRGLHMIQSPLDRMEAHLHATVSYSIVPLFALTHAGLSLRGFQLHTVIGSVFSGVFLGLLLGKPLGITAAAWLAVRMRLAELPAGVCWAQLHAAAWLGGIGFTVSLFIAGLAFGTGAEAAVARTAVLAASCCAAALGATLLAIVHPLDRKHT
jgi:Na+:H+ antiporter, NhaA family